MFYTYNFFSFHRPTESFPAEPPRVLEHGDNGDHAAAPSSLKVRRHGPGAERLHLLPQGGCAGGDLPASSDW